MKIPANLIRDLKKLKKKLFWRNFASSFKKFAFINKLTKRVLYERRD